MVCVNDRMGSPAELVILDATNIEEKPIARIHLHKESLMVFTARGFQTVWSLLMNKNYAQIERQELCDLFESVGPDHPTLCEGWTAADLAAHLVLRENSLKAFGLVVPGYLAKKLAKAT